MGSKYKRLLSLLLVAVMLLSMMPMSAMATEHDHEHEHTVFLSDPESPEGEETEATPEIEEDLPTQEQEVPAEPSVDTPEEPTVNAPAEPPATEPEASADVICHQPGDANSDGEVHLDDAFYVLYNSTLSDMFPINHNADYNGDGKVDTADALLVLKYAHGLAEIPHFTHEFFAPVWTWEANGTEATFISVSFRCSCPNTEPTILDESSGVTVVLAGSKEANCTEAGFVSYTATVEFEGQTYSNTYTITTDALKHDMGEPTCTESATCVRDNCGYTLPATGHTWNLTSEEPADCDSLAVYHYACACGATDSVSQEEGSFVHDWVYDHDVRVEEIPCAYVKGYTCANTECGATTADKIIRDEEGTLLTELIYRHSYKASIQEATCRAEGVKTLTCECGATITESISVDPEAHDWVAGQPDENGIITHTCANGCDSTKTTVETNVVSKEVLAQIDEMKLDDKGTSISMDASTKEALGEEVSVNVSVADESATANLSDMQKAQIGDNPVYNFTMTSDEEEVSQFEGLVTISLPYTLQEGDDVDCIDIWFIDDSGNVEVKMGTYSNGLVTFTTDHFSYYTVTRLTPAERCATYGHTLERFEKAATCSEEGYVMFVCQRCGMEDKDNPQAETRQKLEHSYEVTKTEPTCTTNGIEVKTCSSCGDTVRTTLFQLGHTPVLTDSKPATCTAAGYETYTCQRECGYERTVQLDAPGHNYEYTDTVYATCTTTGYELYTCSNCSDAIHRNEQPVLGHSYKEAKDAWTWNGTVAATVTLVCEHDPSHTTTQKAVVTEVRSDADCTTSGSATYTARVSYLNVVYEKVKHDTLEAVGHITTDTEWSTTAAKHYKTCDACGIRVDQADHNWGTPVVTKEPTCVAPGTATVTCTVCNYSKPEAIRATGIHEDKDDDNACDECSFVINTCSHELTASIPMDLSGYNVCPGTQFNYNVCGCGEHKEGSLINMVCMMPDATETYTMQNSAGHEVTVSVYPCTDCDLEMHYAWVEITPEDSCGMTSYIYTKIVIGDTVLSESETTESYPFGHSPATNLIEKTLTADGFCGADIEVSKCKCGDYIMDYSMYYCDFQYVEGYGTICTKCGASMTRDPNTEYADCKEIWTDTVILTYNGETLITFDTITKSTCHSYELDSYVMDGESCTDGVTYTYKCIDCGHSYTEHDYVHYWFTDEIIDVTSWDNPCMSHIRTVSCVCGDTYWYYEENYREDAERYGHAWDIIRDDPETGTTVGACSACGYTCTSVAKTTELGDNCAIRYDSTETISDGGDRSITMKLAYYGNEHSYQDQYTLRGDSCEDGVEARAVCTKCGNESGYFDVYYYHVGKYLDTVKLADYGGCDTVFCVYECLCGENKMITVDRDNCQWSYVDGSFDYATYQCLDCGISRKVTTKTLDKTSRCESTVLETYTFTKNGRTLDVLSCTHTQFDHTRIYEMELNEGAVTCNDGYHGTGTCIFCGQTETYETDPGNGCHAWATDVQVSPEDTFCGTMYIENRVCACGNYTESTRYWVNGNCDFSSRWDEEEERYVYFCVNCGIEEVYNEVLTKIEGETCAYDRREIVSYFDGDECVFAYELEDITYRHNTATAFQLLDGAEDCDDGYTKQTVCQDCGELLNDFEGAVHYGCIAELVSASTISIGKTICGPIAMESHSCACGKEAYTTYSASNCSMEQYDYDSETDTYLHRCTNDGCTLRYSSKQIITPVEGNPCLANCLDIYTYYDGDEVLFSYETPGTTEFHKSVTTYTRLGSTCDDGFRIRQECALCGELLYEDPEDYINYGCSNNRTQYIRLYQSSCGIASYEVYSCACGMDYNAFTNDSCSFDLIRNDEDQNLNVYQCVNCGVERHETTDYELYDASSCAYKAVTEYVYYLDGVRTGSYTSRYMTNRHNSEYVYDLQGETCEDGYYRSKECTVCDHVEWREDYLQYGCSVEYADTLGTYFEGEAICGPISVEQHVCGCGKTAAQYITTDCSFDYFGYDEEWEGERYQCTSCGLMYISRSAVQYDRANCQYHYSGEQVYYLNGEHIGTISLASHSIQHVGIVSEFTLLGNTCAEGFTYTSECAYCHKSQGSITEPEFGCYGHLVDIDLVLSHPDTCGIIEFSTYRCACGKSESFGWSYNCNFESIEHEEGANIDIAKCIACGLIRKIESGVIYDEENCTRTDYSNYTYLLNGKTVGTYRTEDQVENHITQATFDIADGASCKDGYYVTHDCIYCDYSRTEEDMRYSHDTFEIATNDLSQYGACGLEIHHYSCACGKVQNSGFNESKCYFEPTENTDENGGTIYECSGCGLSYSHFNSDHQTDIENCTYSYLDNYRFYRNGEEVVTVSVLTSSVSHVYLMTGAELNDPEIGCPGGYTVTLQCPSCLDAYQETVGEYQRYHDYTYAIDYFSLKALGGCDTYIELSSCACGQYSNITGSQNCIMEYTHSSEKDSAGIDHNYTTGTCTVCGYTYTSDSYMVPSEDPCFLREHTVRVNTFGEHTKTLSSARLVSNHDYKDISMQLMEGSVTCTDGVEITSQCSYCGDITTNRCWGDHPVQVTERYDLTEYGSVCGGSLAKYVCLCGYVNRYDLADVECDLDQQSTANFVPHAIESEYQQTAEGGRWTESFAWIFKCAVTDPQQCGLTIRMSEYWIADEQSCIATEYQVWQLGYDEATETYALQVGPLATGETRGFHTPYEYTENRYTDESGNRITVYRYDCPVCGSYSAQTDMECPDGSFRSSHDQINTLNNGEQKEFHSHHYYDYVIGSDHLDTEYYYENVYANGSVYWYKEEYSYDPENPCNRTTVYTSSEDSSGNTSNEIVHWDSYTSEWIKSPTCTQVGKLLETTTCRLCGDVRTNISIYNPYEHDWWYEDDRFVCSRCGLESTTGANGDITVEDLSDANNYIIGYYNRGQIPFTPSLSVVLEMDNEPVLTGLHFDYWTEEANGVQAVVISRTQVETALRELFTELNYVGAYCVRIAFVPTGSQGSLDYAITFDPQYCDGFTEADPTEATQEETFPDPEPAPEPPVEEPVEPYAA